MFFRHFVWDILSRKRRREDAKLLVGFKQSSFIDSGYFYVPYIPITSTSINIKPKKCFFKLFSQICAAQAGRPIVLDPESYRPRRGILTRYGKKLLEEGSKFYKRISIPNFYEQTTKETPTSEETKGID